LGLSVAIHAAGPSIVFVFILGGALVYFIMYALSEMTVANPAMGSFRSFAAKAFGRGTGFVVGWVYWAGMILAMSSEATAISILLREWFPAISLPLVGSLIIAGVTGVNLLGAEKLSKLESGLAAIKIFAIGSFVVVGVLLVAGIISGNAPVGLSVIQAEPLMPGGFTGILGSILLVMFAYAGFEIIGLAASEAKNPKDTIPKAIRYTVILLAGLYIFSIVVILPLIPTAEINTQASPFVAALNRHGIGWAGTVLNIVLVTAILSTMLAAMFGLGRMMRSLADEGMAPAWLKDKKDVPYRGILISGFAMLAALAFGLLFPSAYIFLISSGGFAILLTYVIIMATHMRIRKSSGCPPDGKCQMWGYPYTSIFVIAMLLIAMASMPFVPGQASGLIAGLILTAFFTGLYALVKAYKRKKSASTILIRNLQANLNTESSRELGEKDEGDDNKK
ncbi:MAG: amino acid permease, partial [Eubacteriales bacterium]